MKIIIIEILSSKKGACLVSADPGTNNLWDAGSRPTHSIHGSQDQIGAENKNGTECIVQISFIKKFKFSEHLTNSTSGCLAVQFLILHSMSLSFSSACPFIQRREEFLHLVVILSRDNRLGSSYGLSTDELSTPAPFPYIVTVGNLNPPTLSPFSPMFPHL